MDAINLQIATSGSSPRAARASRALYLKVLTWAFTIFSSARVLAYLPTMWAITSAGGAGQHSLLTWLTLCGANVTMAAWIFEQNGQRFSSVVGVNISNAVMCAVTAALILVFS